MCNLKQSTMVEFGYSFSHLPRLLSYNYYSYFYTIPLIILIPILVITLTIFLNRKSPKDLPPGSFGWPILGESLEFIRTRNAGSSADFVLKRFQKYNTQVFKTSLFGEPIAVLKPPHGNKFLFTNDHKLVTTWWPSTVNNLLGKCISTSPTIQMRKTASYFFTPDAFTKLYIKTMDAVSKHHLNTRWHPDVVHVYPAVKLYTFELACRLFMSIHDPDLIQRLAALFRVFTAGIISIPFYFPGTKYYNATTATVAIKKELLAIVKQRRAALEQTTPSPQDLLSHLLVTPDENGEYMSESVIVNNILLMLFAGHDTSSSAITMLIKVLGENRDVYQKVLEEQIEIGKGKECLEWEDVQKMKYSWSVVLETMRIWPPVLGAFREALTDISYGGYRIPKGWKLYWNARVSQGDSRFFPESEKFDPGRFDVDAGEDGGPIPYTYVPFGGGPRMCLGREFARLEILTFLHNLIPRFEWSVVDPNEKILCDPIPAPENGLPVRLRLRTNTT